MRAGKFGLLPYLLDKVMVLVEEVDEFIIEVGGQFVLRRLGANYSVIHPPFALLRSGRSLDYWPCLQKLVRLVLRASIIEVNHFEILEVVQRSSGFEQHFQFSPWVCLLRRPWCRQLIAHLFSIVYFLL